MTVGLHFLRFGAIFRANNAEKAAQAGQAEWKMNSDRTVLTDAMWDRIEHLLPGKAGDRGTTAADNRLFLEAVLWRTRAGAPWRDLPKRFGKWNSVFKRFRRWTLAGVFERVFNALSGDFDFEYVFIDGTIVQAHQKASGAKGGPAATESGAPGAA